MSIGLARHYGKSAAREARGGRPNNAKTLARISAHHALNRMGNAGSPRNKAGICGCELGALPATFDAMIASER